ncbi:MAG: hypothetical protein HQL31_03855 [Planctomycetes bacterium]|nr:hypothetical protein [Planctomycetota bacterium]
MKKWSALSSLVCGVLFALACGGGSNVNIPPGTIISGTIDDGALSKPRLVAGGILTGTATAVGTGRQYEVRVNSNRSYTVEVTRGEDINIEVRNGSTVILSRVLPSAQVSSQTLSANINALTHLQARMALAQINNSGAADLATALATVNRSLFGSEAVSASTLNNLPTALRELTSDSVVAIVATLQWLSASSFSGVSVLEALQSFTANFDTLQSAGTSALISVFETVVNGAGTLVSNAISSAFLSTQNTASVTNAIASASVFSELIQNITNATFPSYALHSPVFGSASDSLRTAAPGVLFSYTFPLATTEDALGVSGYTGAWTGTAPSGPSEFNMLTRELLLIPSEADRTVGSFTFGVTAVGANGRNDTTSVTLSVKNLELTGLNRKLLGSAATNDGSYQPELGPVLSGDYMYLVALYSSNLRRLERYPLSGLTSSGIDTVQSFNSWPLPEGTGVSRDFLLKGDLAYITTAWSGILAYDVTGASGSAPEYLASGLTATSLTTFGSYLYGLDATTFSAVRLPLTLGTATNLGSVSAMAEDIQADEIGVYGDYIYLAGAMTATFYSPYSSSFLAEELSSSVNLELLQDNRDVENSPLYAVMGDDVTQLTIENASFVTSVLTGVSVTGSSRANGTYAFIVQSNTDVVQAHSLQGATGSALGTMGTYAVDYANAGELKVAIRNIPEGIESGRSGAYVFTVGQYSTDVFSATTEASWYVKPFVAQPNQ